MENMEEKILLNDEELEAVDGGAGEQSVGVKTPLGEYPAEDLIEMYNNDPAGAVWYINMAKAVMPGLINDFQNECSEKNLIIPDGLKKALGI